MTPISLGMNGRLNPPARRPLRTDRREAHYGLYALRAHCLASSLDQVGPFAKNVTDAAMLLEVVAGHDEKDSTSLPEPSPSLVAHVEDGVAGKRIGWFAISWTEPTRTS